MAGRQGIQPPGRLAGSSGEGMAGRLTGRSEVPLLWLLSSAKGCGLRGGRSVARGFRIAALLLAFALGLVGSVHAAASDVPEEELLSPQAPATAQQAAPGPATADEPVGEPSVAPAPVEFFPVDEVRPGLSGYGLTVVEGTRVERFEVEILGVVRGAGPAGDLILVRVFGPAVDASGGIAAGMSGSPVYVAGKLLGAIGFGFEFSDHSVGLVTPIGDMLEVMRLLDREGAPQEPGSARDDLESATSPGASASGAAGGGEADGGGLAWAGYRRLAWAASAREAARLAGQVPAGTAVMVPVATPVMVSGFGPRTFMWVRRWLSRYGLMVVPGGVVGPGGVTGPGGGARPGGAGKQTPAGGGRLPEAAVPLGPGSALGISLVRGDVELTAIGTVTYVEGDRFVAFGHPFLQKGSVDFFAAPAFIHRTVKSVQVPFKVGSAFEPVGTLAEDRRAAVAGRIGPQADALELVVEVRDVTSGRRRTLTSQVVRDDLLSVPLVAVAGLEALDRGLDRIGPGTAHAIYRIYGSGLPGSGVYVQDNAYFSRLDISARLLGDVLDTLQTLLFNRIQDLDIRRVELAVDVDSRQRTAAIVRAQPLSDRVRPGQSVPIEVELLAYRGEREVRVVNLEVPEGVGPGRVTVTVRGGAGPGPGALSELETLLTGGQEPNDQTGLGPPEEGEVPTSLEKLLELLDGREKNNQLIAEFYPPYAASAEGMDGKPSGSDTGSKSRSPSRGSAKGDTRKTSEGVDPGKAIKASLLTPWVIEGSVDFELTIEDPAAEDLEGESVSPNHDPFRLP